MDVGHQSSSKTAPSAYLEDDSVFSQERLNFKSDDHFKQDNVLDKNEGPKLDYSGADEEMRVGGTSSNTSKFPDSCHSKETPPLKSRTRGVVITRKNMDKIKGYDLKLCSSISSPSKQCLRPSECLPVSENHSASVRLNSLTKRTLHDYTAAALNKKKLPAKYRKVQFSSSIPVQESAPSQSDWTPFEFVDSSVIIKKEVTTNSDVFVDENTSSSKRELLPSTSVATVCSAPPTQKKFSCEQCMAKFTTKFALSVHKLDHSGGSVWFCDQCDARFIYKSQLEKHIRVHSNERDFSCTQCSARFKTNSALKKHVTSHLNERAFSCSQCTARFNTKSGLQNHMISHSNERAFSCSQCTARFKTNTALKIHLMSHSNERAFSCGQCSARFKSNVALRSHLVVHCDEKAYTCDYCAAQFKRKREIKDHLLTHTSKRPLSCNQCFAEYNDISELQKHMLIHSSKKRFSCDQCSTMFKFKRHLRIHMLLHSDDNVFNVNALLRYDVRKKPKF